MICILEIIREKLNERKIIVHKYNHGNISTNYVSEPYESHGSAIKYKGKKVAAIKGVDLSDKKYCDFTLVINVDGTDVELDISSLNKIEFYEVDN